MANVFDVTTATEKVTAENGMATAVFTVTNNTDQAIRSIVKIKPLDDTERKWLSIEGEAERDFSPNGTQQYTVNFEKPETASAAEGENRPAESFPFRFDVVSSINPDEDFTEGPTVTVEIPEEKIPEPNGFPIWIPIVAGIVLLAVIGGVVGYLLLRDDRVEVPNVLEKSFDQAKAEIEEAGFKATKKEEIAPDKTLDVIFKQNPANPEKAEPDSVVTLSIPETAKVPPLKNKTLAQAVNALQQRNLILGKVRGDAEAFKNGKLNAVSSQSPGANKTVAKGTKVNLVFPCTKPFPRNCITIDPNLTIQPNVVVDQKVESLLKEAQKKELIIKENQKKLSPNPQMKPKN